MIECAYNTFFCLLIFFFRDLVGFGTLTLPGWRRIIYLHLPFSGESAYAGAFFATIPGGLTLFSIILAVYIYVSRKFDIISRVYNNMEKN